MRALLRDGQDQTRIALEVEEAVYDPESNQLFLTMPRTVINELLKDYFFYFWDEAIHEIRFVTSFDTTEEDIAQLLQSVKRLL